VMVPEYLGAAAPGVGAMTMEEASIQAMPPIVIRRGCFMISPFILRQSEWLFSDGSLASAMPKSAARDGEVQGAAGRNEERVVRSGVLLLTTSTSGTWQEPGDVGLEGERTGSVPVSPNVTGDGAKGHAWRCCYARRGYVDHQTLSFDAYLKFIEDDFWAASASTRRTTAGPTGARTCARTPPSWVILTEDFDFDQGPRPPLTLPTDPSRRQ